MELGNQVGIPTVILAKGSQGLYFLTSKSEMFLGRVSQAVSVCFVQLKAAVSGEICSSPLQACTPHGTGFPSGLWLLGFWAT